jgi:polyisoprenoid-binding protein YceI
MLKKLLLSFFFLGFSPSALLAAPDKYSFDKDHTHILFFVSHVGFSDSIGRIDDFDGYFTFDEKEPEASSLDVTIKASSIDTGVAELDKTLRGDKFLDVEKFPLIHFRSTQIVVTGAKKGDVTGELTLLGVTKPLTLHVRYNRSGIHPFTNNFVSGFSADAVIRRSDFGMNAYIPAVGDAVRIHIEAEGIDPFRHPGSSKAPH